MRNRRPYGFRYRLAQFFAGRNGADTIYFVCFTLSLVFIFLSGIFYTCIPLRYTFFALYFISLGYSIFRLFSRNLAKRRAENAAFRRAFGKLFLPFRRLSLRIRNRKTHVFRKCPHCKNTLRLARIPGEHTVRCPACGERFSVTVKGRKGEK